MKRCGKKYAWDSHAVHVHVGQDNAALRIYLLVKPVCNVLITCHNVTLWTVPMTLCLVRVCFNHVTRKPALCILCEPQTHSSDLAF